jgi:hypothetical protein
VGEFVDERCFDEGDKKRNKTAHLGLGVFSGDYSYINI